jgi:hypothetical protein
MYHVFLPYVSCKAWIKPDQPCCFILRAIQPQFKLCRNPRSMTFALDSTDVKLSKSSTASRDRLFSCLPAGAPL